MALAMTATIASPGPSSGTSTCSTCRLLRGSLSRLARPENMSTSSLCTVTARYFAGISSAAKVSGERSPERIASRMACIVVLLRNGRASQDRGVWAETTCGYANRGMDMRFLPQGYIHHRVRRSQAPTSCQTVAKASELTVGDGGEL